MRIGFVLGLLLAAGILAACGAPAAAADTYIDVLAGEFGVTSPFDPVDWWLWTPNPLNASGFGAGVWNDRNSGLNAWQVTDASTATQNPSYVSNLGATTVATALTSGWRLRSLARFVDDYDGDGVLGIAAFLNDRAYVMSFDLIDGDLRVTLQDETPRTFQVTTGGTGTSAFNHFELRSASGNIVEAVFEGRSLTSNWDGVWAATGHPGLVQWGSVLNLAGRRGAMNFNKVQFDLGPPTDPLGDFDWSGRADGKDLLVWQRGYGSTTALLADADGNGAVNGNDLSIWIDGFGERPQFVARIPEPHSAAIAAIGALAAWAMMRRKDQGSLGVS